MKRLFGAHFVSWFKRLLRKSKYRWFIIFGSLVYLVSPLDISPDLFPVIGWIDDGLLATLVVTELTQIAIENRRNRIKKSTNLSDSMDHKNIIDIGSESVN